MYDSIHRPKLKTSSPFYSNQHLIQMLMLSLLTLGPWVPSLATAQASENSSALNQTHDVQLAMVRYDGDWNPRGTGLSRLAWEIRNRTSIDMDLSIADVRLEETDLFNYPMLVWAGTAQFPPLSKQAIGNLRQYLRAGGFVFIDAVDGQNSGFYQSIVQTIHRLFENQTLYRLPIEHVLYKSFYLLNHHAGRLADRAYLEAGDVNQRLAFLINTNDLLGAMARDEFGSWQYPILSGGEQGREMSARFAINMMMYALCLDYKDDQVHIPFIVQRRQ